MEVLKLDVPDGPNWETVPLYLHNWPVIGFGLPPGRGYNLGWGIFFHRRQFWREIQLWAISSQHSWQLYFGIWAAHYSIHQKCQQWLSLVWGLRLVLSLLNIFQIFHNEHSIVLRIRWVNSCKVLSTIPGVY